MCEDSFTMLFIYLLLKVSLPKDVDITMYGVETEHIGVDRPTSPIPAGKIQAPGQGIKLYSLSSYSHFRMGQPNIELISFLI